MYSQWLETQNRSYRKEALKRLIDSAHTDDFIKNRNDCLKWNGISVRISWNVHHLIVGHL